MGSNPINGSTFIMGTNLFGYVAAFFGIISLWPQLYKTLKTKSAKDISLGMWVLLTITNALWLTHGIVQSDLPLIITNTVATTVDVVMVILKLRYDKKNA